MSEFVTAAEAADILGFSETHVRRHIQSGTIAAEKVKGRWRIAAADLDGVDLGEVAPPNRPTNQTPSQPTIRTPSRPTNQPTNMPRRRGATTSSLRLPDLKQTRSTCVRTWGCGSRRRRRG